MSKLLVQRLHKMIIRRATPDGTIDRGTFFEVIAERLGKVQTKDEEQLIRELRADGLIQDCNRNHVVVAREI